MTVNQLRDLLQLISIYNGNMEVLVSILDEVGDSKTATFSENWSILNEPNYKWNGIYLGLKEIE